MNSKETIPVETGEAPVDKDLVKKEEKRKAELKRLASEEYGARWEQIQTLTSLLQEVEVVALKHIP